MSEPIARPSHLGCCVADLERSLRFYAGLGFEPAEHYELDDRMLAGLDRALEVPAPVRLTSQMITNGAMKIELLHFAAPGPTGAPSASRNQLGLTHLSFFVADVDRVAADLVALGGTVLPQTRTQLGYEVVFLTDPDGVRIELMAPAR